MFIIKAGARLPNGAIIIDYARVSGNEGAVLAMREDSDYDPYVTWRFDMTNGECYWGHYFEAVEFLAAVDDFIERCQR